MAWTTPETFTAGQTLTAASMNLISGNLTELQAGRPSAVTPTCVLRKSSNQTGISSEAVITWQTEDSDTDAMHNGSTNTERITIKTAGVYQLSAVIGLNNVAAGQLVYLRLRKNGSVFLYVTAHDIGAASGWPLSIAVKAAVNDYYDVTAQATTSTITAESAYSMFSAVWVGP